MGIDLGSVSTKIAVVDEDGKLITSVYLRTEGTPIAAVQRVMEMTRKKLPPEIKICGVGTTGSARYLAGVIAGADIIKNEITAQAIGALKYVPDVQTIIEIGGQDSKLIIVRDGIVTDFGMNTVCAAGTGSFLDHQAERLNIKIEDFGPRALNSNNPVRIAGRCTVFAESDMIHKQQMGYPTEDILYGLCQAMARNYINNVGLGKRILPPVVFQGAVAFNPGIVRAFEELLDTKITVTPHPEVTGAIGAALLAQEEMAIYGNGTKFKGFGITEANYHTSSFECKACPNRCEIIQISLDGKVIARWGGRCDMWERMSSKQLK